MIPNLAGGRLTLAGGIAVPRRDIISVKMINWTIDSQNGHNLIDLWNGSDFIAKEFSEIPFILDGSPSHFGFHQAEKVFFLLIFSDGASLRLGTPPAWVSDIDPGTGIGTCEPEFHIGRWVNKYPVNVRTGPDASDIEVVAARQAKIVGAFRATSNGKATDSNARRFLSNIYNPRWRPLCVLEATPTWLLPHDIIRIANDSFANAVDWLHAIPGRVTEVSTMGRSESDVYCADYVGLDSVTLAAVNARNTSPPARAFEPLIADWIGEAGAGRHYAAWLELCIGTDAIKSGGGIYGITGKTEN